jgi:DoxX
MKLHRYPYLELSSRPIARWAPIPLRLIVGYGFLEHGVAKLSKGPDAFAAILHAMGVPDPHLMAWFTILTELLGGFAVILGAFVAFCARWTLAAPQPRPAGFLAGFFDVRPWFSPTSQDSSLTVRDYSRQPPLAQGARHMRPFNRCASRAKIPITPMLRGSSGIGLPSIIAT